MCPRCDPDETQLDRDAYSYLLGLHLGDGCLTDGAAMRKKGVYALNIACADAWPGLMDACEASMRRVMPHNAVLRAPKPGMHEIKAYSKHWPWLFPQHHSDGCRVYNVAVRTRGGVTMRYYYSRYQFTNESPHIRDLFTGTLDSLGIEWRYNRRNCVSIAKRESVRRLDEFVGPKY